MSAVVYFTGSVEAARAAAPEGVKVRFCNAKYFRAGEPEYAKTAKVKGRGMVPVHFDEVFLAPGCRNGEAIRKTYAAFDVPVRSLGGDGGGGKGKAKPEPPATATTPADLGWKLKTMSPAEYLEKRPKGASADLARKILAEIGEG